MPKITFSGENKTKYASDFAKLRLDANERARIIAVQKVPEFEYVHTLRAPALIDGKPVMKSVKQKDGTYKDEPEMEFIGRHICLGSLDVIAKLGVDVKACPVCAESKKSSVVQAPQRRFAMNVMRYKTVPGKFDVAEPFFVECVVWDFTEGRFNTLVGLSEEWGDLRKHDLYLGPCENKTFQNFDVAIAPKAVYLEKKEYAEIVSKTFQANQVSDADLSMIIGRKLSLDQVQEDLEKVVSRSQQAFNPGAAAAAVAPAAVAADMDVAGLFSPTPPTQPAAAAPTQESPWAEPTAPASDDPFAIFEGSDPASSGDPAAPTPPAAPAEAPQELDLDNIDDFFNSPN